MMVLHFFPTSVVARKFGLIFVKRVRHKSDSKISSTRTSFLSSTSSLSRHWKTIGPSDGNMVRIFSSLLNLTVILMSLVDLNWPGKDDGIWADVDTEGGSVDGGNDPVFLQPGHDQFHLVRNRAIELVGCHLDRCHHPARCSREHLLCGR